MDKSSKYKMLAICLAILLMIMTGASSFMSFFLVQTFITGEYPFGIIPYSQEKAAAKKEKITSENIETNEAVENARKKGEGALKNINEKFVRDLYDLLLAEQIKMIKERAKIAQEAKTLEEIKNQAQIMQQELIKRKDNIKKLLIFIDKKEIDNLQTIVKLIESLPLEQGVDMFNSYDVDMAARIMYYMNPNKMKTMISFILESGAANQKTFAAVRTRIKDITEKRHKLSEEVNYD